MLLFFIVEIINIGKRREIDNWSGFSQTFQPKTIKESSPAIGETVNELVPVTWIYPKISIARRDNKIKRPWTSTTPKSVSFRPSCECYGYNVRISLTEKNKLMIVVDIITFKCCWFYDSFMKWNSTCLVIQIDHSLGELKKTKKIAVFTHTNYYEAIPGLSDNAAFLIGLVLRMPAVLRTLPTEVAESCSPSELSSPEISAQVFSLPYRSRRTFAITASFASSVHLVGRPLRKASSRWQSRIVMGRRLGSNPRVIARAYILLIVLFGSPVISATSAVVFPLKGALRETTKARVAMSVLCVIDRGVVRNWTESWRNFSLVDLNVGRCFKSGFLACLWLLPAPARLRTSGDCLCILNYFSGQ